MAQQDDPQEDSYPTGRGYGHDYMRGGELLGGYGYSARPDYQRRRGEDGQGEEPSTSDGGLQQRSRRQPDSDSPERPVSDS